MKAFLTQTSLSERLETVKITGSKSESNRLLVLQALFPNITIQNLSNSDDTSVLQKGLKSAHGTIDIHHAGTAMRFLTAYFACKPNASVLLTGSPRMQERPIGILVEALRKLGAHISYEKEEGYPPLRIQGQSITTSQISINAQTSSQFITALMLIAPSLENGLKIHLEGEVTSRPYIEMTRSLLKEIGVSTTFTENNIGVLPTAALPPVTITVESDWSSASYFYSLVALSDGLKIKMQYFRSDSRQGDAQLANLFESLGVHTEFLPEEHAVLLSKNAETLEKEVNFNLIQTPDIAQTIAVCCFGLGIGCKLTGLHTLKIKETDRLVALQIELQKLGAQISVDQDSLTLAPSATINENIAIDTYHDHRMAMAFAPLVLKTSLVINDAGVVSKSFPGFWETLQKLGLKVNLQ